MNVNDARMNLDKLLKTEFSHINGSRMQRHIYKKSVSFLTIKEGMDSNASRRHIFHEALHEVFRHKTGHILIYVLKNESHFLNNGR